MMKHFKNNKKISIISLAVAIIAFGTFSFRPPSQHGHKEKLKVLSSKINHEDLFSVMHKFKRALGYSCDDCHAKSATNPKELDFASYANPHKKVALDMMKMVEKINRRNFGIKGSFEENYLNNTYMVTCYTCHHGSPHPAINLKGEKE